MTKKPLESFLDEITCREIAKTDTRMKDFFSITDEYEASARDFMEATFLADDEIKVQMLHYLHPRIEAIFARDEGLKISVESSYEREFALKEMQEISKEYRELAFIVRKKLNQLN